MAPILSGFLSVVSLLLIAADRASLQEHVLTLDGDEIPLPALGNSVSQNFVDVARRTLPTKVVPPKASTFSLKSFSALAPRRVPRVPRLAAHSPGGGRLADDALLGPLERSLRAPRERRDIRDQLWGNRSPRGRAGTSTRKPNPASEPRRGPHRPNSLGELREDLMIHGRDRDQLRRRWKIDDANNRVANVHG